MNKHYKVIIEITLDIEAPDRNQALKAAKTWDGEITSCCVGKLNYSLRRGSNSRIKSAKWVRRGHK